MKKGGWNAIRELEDEGVAWRKEDAFPLCEECGDAAKLWKQDSASGNWIFLGVFCTCEEE